MIDKHPKAIIIIGFFLVLIGVIVPLLMIFQILKSTYLLNFLGYAASISGVFLGIIGGAVYVKRSRKKKE